MSDLQGRIGRLEQDINARPSPARWRALLAPYFTSHAYDGHREALLDALCGPNPAYHFAVEGGPEQGRYSIFWWTRSGPPVVMRIQRVGAGER
jgi:hypothetical protein